MPAEFQNCKAMFYIFYIQNIMLMHIKARLAAAREQLCGAQEAQKKPPSFAKSLSH